MHGQSVCILRNFEICMIGLDHVGGTNDVTALIIPKDFSNQPEILWGDAKYHEEDW